MAKRSPIEVLMDRSNDSGDLTDERNALKAGGFPVETKEQREWREAHAPRGK